jgi:hypothetical protein
VAMREAYKELLNPQKEDLFFPNGEILNTN